MLLTAYLDESGTHDASKTTVVGGLLATEKQLLRFERDFARLKKKHRFSVFHAKKFKSRSGDFARWTVPQCHALMDDFTKLFRANHFADYAHIAIDNAQYRAEYKIGHRPRGFVVNTAYTLGVEKCIRRFLEATRASKYRSPKIEVICESGHRNAGDAARMFSELKKQFTETEFDGMLGTIRFEDKAKCNPLMLADFAAHVRYMLETNPTIKIPAPEPGTIRRGQKMRVMSFAPAGGLANDKRTAIDMWQEARKRPRR